MPDMKIAQMGQDRAETFLETHGFQLRVTPRGRGCPPGEDTCRFGKHNHGSQFSVVIKRIGAPKGARTANGTPLKPMKYGFTFNHWQPRDDMGFPTPADIIRGVALALAWPIDADAVFEKLGGSARPSKAFALATLSLRFHEFLTASEVEELSKWR